jgi:26S proteasome regulatory subunit N9
LLLGDLAECKKSLDECEKVLNEQDTVEPVVYAGYYGVAGDYHKVKAEYGPYYKHALLYLACVDVDKELSDEDRKARAHDLCIAALLGENIYNFGELVRDNVNTDLEKAELMIGLAATPNPANARWDGTRVDQGSHQRVQQWRDWQIREHDESLFLRGERFRQGVFALWHTR